MRHWSNGMEKHEGTLSKYHDRPADQGDACQDWAAITQPDQMMLWWGPDAGPTLNVVADVRPGGRFSVVFRLLNGEEHNPTGIYQEVVPNGSCRSPGTCPPFRNRHRW